MEDFIKPLGRRGYFSGCKTHFSFLVLFILIAATCSQHKMSQHPGDVHSWAAAFLHARAATRSVANRSTRLSAFPQQRDRDREATLQSPVKELPQRARKRSQDPNRKMKVHAGHRPGSPQQGTAIHPGSENTNKIRCRDSVSVHKEEPVALAGSAWL